MNWAKADNSLIKDLKDFTATFFQKHTLLSVLLHIPMQEIVQQLPLAGCIKDALSHHGGRAGQLLLALEAAAHRNLNESARLLSLLDISPDTFLAAQLDALHWAERIPTP